MSNQQSWSRSAAALFAAWTCRSSRPTSATNSRNWASCAGNRPSPSSSAVAKWVIRPTVFGLAASRSASSRSFVPSRLIPVSSFTCTRGAASATTSVQATTSALASMAACSSSRVSAPITSSEIPMPAFRSSTASAAVATASHPAPPRSAAFATGTIPCPYAFAFTTAQSGFGSRAELRSIAPRSMSATARTSRSERAEHVQPGHHADQLAVLDDRKPVVTGIVDEPRGLADAGVRTDRVDVAGHHVGGVGGERLAQAIPEAAQRLEEDRAPKEVDVVRDVQVAVVVWKHEVGLGDDAPDCALRVHDRQARQLVLAQRGHHVLHGRLGRDRDGVRIHDLADLVCHGRDLTEGGSQRRVKPCGSASITSPAITWSGPTSSAA